MPAYESRRISGYCGTSRTGPAPGGLTKYKIADQPLTRLLPKVIDGFLFEWIHQFAENAALNERITFGQKRSSQFFSQRLGESYDNIQKNVSSGT